MNIRPFGAKVLLTLDGVLDDGNESSSGIILTSAKPVEDKAIVVAVGEECRYTKPGTEVVFRPHVADHFSFEKKWYLVVEELDIIGVVGE